MAEYFRVGTPTNDSERLGISKLRDELPEHFIVVGNFELQLPRRRNTLEYDAVVIGEWGVYTVEIKGWGGTIEGDQSRWHLEWGEVENPFIRIEQKAKALRDFLVRRVDGFPRELFCEAVVYLPRDDARVEVDDPRNERLVTHGEVWKYFVDEQVHRGPGLLNDAELRDRIRRTIHERAEPGEMGPQIPDYVVDEELDNVGRPYREYLGHHQLVKSRDRVRIKAYSMDPLLSRAEQQKKLNEAMRDLEALDSLKDNDYIAKAYDVRRDEGDELLFYLISEWVGRRTLGDFIDEDDPSDTSPRAMRRRVVAALHLARAVQYVHDNNVVHRNLHPDAAYLIDKEDRDVPLQLADFDYARLGHLQSIGGGLSAVGNEGYVAPEMWNSEPHDHRADIYSLGLILFELFVGEPLYRSIDDILNFDDIWAERRQRVPRTELQRRLGPMLTGSPDERTVTLHPLIDTLEDLLEELDRAAQPSGPIHVPAPPTSGFANRAGE